MPADRIEQGFWPLPGRRESFSFAGFDYDAETPPNPEVTVAAPHWALVLAAGALPAARAWKFRKRRDLLRRGLCPSCAYDLRATPDRCPKCGTQACSAGILPAGWRSR